jgi:hypothetical protein
VSYGELERLFEQFFALVEAAVHLPPGLERRIAFRDVRDYLRSLNLIALPQAATDANQAGAQRIRVIRHQGLAGTVWSG